MAGLEDKNCQELEKLLQQSKGSRFRLLADWYLNCAFFEGNQWLWWNRGRLDPVQLADWRVKYVDNRIIGIVNTELAKMTKQKPAWQVIPVTGEDSDLEASETGEKVLDYLWRYLHMRNKLMDALRWSRVTGAGFWKIAWDSEAGQKVQIVADPEGQPVMHGETGAPMRPHEFEGQLPEGLQQKSIATGDVMVEVVSPFEFYPDPVARELEDCEWCIQRSIKSSEYVKEHYNVDIEPDTDVAPGPSESRMFATFQEGGSGYKGVTVSEYWSRPNTKDPDGVRVVWAKNKELLREANPYKKLPYVMFKGIPVAGRFWPTSTTSQLRSPQMALNKAESQVTENAQRIGNPSLLASKQANIQYSGVPGERIDYDDTTQNAKPEYLQAPPLPNYVTQQQERAEQSMQDISGQHEVSNAQVPAGVKAASAINLLQEADDTRLGPAIYDMEEALGVAGSMLLKLIAEYWTDERVIMIAGEDHAWNTMLFRGAALKENTHVEVQSGSSFPRSKAAKQAAMESALGFYLQNSGGQAPDPLLMKKFFRDFEAGALEKLFGDVDADTAQANRENTQMAQGAEIPINPFDNHQVHIDAHTEFQKGPTYQNFPPPLKGLIEQHVSEHREQALAEQPPPQHAIPSESLAYKDAPPDIKRQIEQQAGLEPSKEPAPTPAQEAKPEGATSGK